MPNRIDETQSKRCTKCGVIKTPKQFDPANKRKDGTYGLCSVCRECRYKQTSAYYRENKGKFLAYYKRSREKNKANPRRRYMAALWYSKSKANKEGFLPCNATPEELALAFTGKCHVCGVPEIECRVRLHMDHCHKTGKFRGWLCENCNKAAGHLKDSPEIAMALALYVEHWKEPAEKTA